MKTRELKLKELAKNEDWAGNNIALTCPLCGKVYVVSGFMHPDGRRCPSCGKSKGLVKKEKESEEKHQSNGMSSARTFCADADFLCNQA